jgi:hypothetical protein
VSGFELRSVLSGFSRTSSSHFLLIALTAHVCAAADRHWQTGTWVDAAIKRTPYVGAGAGTDRPFGPDGGRSVTPLMPEVGTYVIETDNERIELQDMVPIASGGSLDPLVVLGAKVTFAIEKKTAYIRKPDGKEHRLLVVARAPRAAH